MGQFRAIPRRGGCVPRVPRPVPVPRRALNSAGRGISGSLESTKLSPPEPIIFFPEDSLAPLSTVFSTPHPPRYVVNISESREHRHLREDFNPSTFELVRENPGYNLVISRSIA